VESYQHDVNELDGLYSQLYTTCQQLFEKEVIPVQGWEKLNAAFSKYEATQTNTDNLLENVDKVRARVMKLQVATAEIPGMITKILRARH